MSQLDLPPPSTEEFYAKALFRLTEDGGFLAEDNTGQVNFANREEYDAFINSGDTVAEFLDSRGRDAITESLHERLPNGEVADGVCKAIDSVLGRLQSYSREKVQMPSTTDAERYDLMRSERDVTAALRAIVIALDLYAEDDAKTEASPRYDYYLDTHTYYGTGKRSRNGGYVAEYDVCTDDFYPDDEDHADIIKMTDKEDSDWPDEFHHPATLTIRVDPQKRIEFTYAHKIEVAKQRHASHSEVQRDGVSRVYDNEALSIRIDLDPTAPHGIALDVGRSAYEGERNGQKMTRNADLLGVVLSRTSPTGSHEYEGFEAGMAEQFTDFAERLAIQLDLQNKEHKATVRQHELARAGLKAAA